MVDNASLCPKCCGVAAQSCTFCAGKGKVKSEIKAEWADEYTLNVSLIYLPNPQFVHIEISIPNNINH